MAVTALLDALTAHLSARLTGAASVGVAAPAAAADLPLVALSLPLVQVRLRGVGRETGVERYAGDLAAETFAADVHGVVTVSGAVADALAAAGGATGPPVAGLRRLEPRSIGPVLSAGATGDLAGARTRRLTFAFDFELETPAAAAGEPIRSIEVGLLPGPNNDFTVAREGN